MSDLLAKNIRYYRKKANLTQAELANLTSVSQMSIRRYETIGEGNREPSLASLHDIAKALNVEVWELYQEKIFIPTEKHKTQSAIERQQEEKELAFINTMDMLGQKLNKVGQEKAIEQVELLTKIPEYRKNLK